MATLTHILSPAHFKPVLDRELRRLLDDAVEAAGPIDASYAQLMEAMRDTLLAGGKRLRPYLTFVAYSGLGGADPAAIMPAAASQELLHHFLLIHDDIIDRDLTRHGGPNVEGMYHRRLTQRGLTPDDAMHYAESFALLAGNAASTLGLQAITQSQVSPELKLEALECVQRMLFEVMGGELTDVDISLPGSAISPERLLRVCHYKTATYSFQTPLLVGAILAGASPAVRDQLAQVGRALGIAFQLADDLLGVYGDEAKLGKPVTSDLREGKQTLLMYHAFQLATPAQRQILHELWGKRQGDAADLAEVRAIVRACGARAKTTQHAEAQVAQSLAALKTVPFSIAAKTELERLAHFCIDRQY